MKKEFVTIFMICLFAFAAQGCGKQHRPIPPHSAEESSVLEDQALSNIPPELIRDWQPDRKSRSKQKVPHSTSSNKRRSSTEKNNEKTADMLVQLAKTTLGTPYVFGGSSRDGFDCSGLVRWTYSHFGINLPRRAVEQARMGRPIYDTDDLQAGDLVTFRHPKRGHHVGIYVGDGKFIHSPRRNKNVTIVSMDDDYFRRSYTGARRLDPDVDDERLDEVEDIINAYKADVGHRQHLRAKDEASSRRSAARLHGERRQQRHATTHRSRDGRHNARNVSTRGTSHRESVKVSREKQRRAAQSVERQRHRERLDDARKIRQQRNDARQANKKEQRKRQQKARQQRQKRERDKNVRQQKHKNRQASAAQRNKQSRKNTTTHRRGAQ